MSTSEPAPPSSPVASDAMAFPPVGDVVTEPSQHVTLHLLTVMRQALEKLPAERAAAEQAHPRERMYRKGLVDGAEETIGALFDALCRGCAGGHGLADNAHTRDARCIYGGAS